MSSWINFIALGKLAIALGKLASDAYIQYKSDKFDLLEGEIVIKKDTANPGMLCLTNKRLRYQCIGLDNNSYYSYPLSAIITIKPLIGEDELELEFSDGRKEGLFVSQRDDWATKILEAKNSLGGADAIERAQDGTVLDADKTTLRKNLTNCFNESELRTLCFDLHIDHEIIPGGTKEEKARELIVYCEHHGLLIRLLKKCQQQRPHVKWI